jgi:hypothetical protein
LLTHIASPGSTEGRKLSEEALAEERKKLRADFDEELEEALAEERKIQKSEAKKQLQAALEDEKNEKSDAQLLLEAQNKGKKMRDIAFATLANLEDSLKQMKHCKFWVLMKSEIIVEKKLAKLLDC